MIYGLVDADTLELRYIGKTLRPEARQREHIQRWPDFRLVVLERDPTDLDIAERRWIAEMRQQGALLLNKSDGGEGTAGLQRSQENKDRVSAGLRGHAVSEATRTKIAESLIGRSVPLVVRAKISEGLKGYVRSVKHRAALGAATRRRYEDPIYRARMGAAISAAWRRKRRDR